MYHFHETTTTMMITATTTTMMKTTTTVVLFIVSLLLRIGRSDDQTPPSSTTPDAFNGTATVPSLTDDEGNSTVAPLDEEGGAGGGHAFDSGTLLRTMYVFVGVALIVGVYFVVRSLLVRCRKNRKTKYGLLATNDDTVEMRHLEEEEEEDAMVFDRTQSNSHRR